MPLNGLGVLSDRFAVGNIGIDDPRITAVQRHAALLPEHRIAVDVQAIEHEIVRHLRQIGLRRVAGAQRDDVAGAALIGEKLQEHQLPMIRGRRGGERGEIIR